MVDLQLPMQSVPIITGHGRNYIETNEANVSYRNLRFFEGGFCFILRSYLKNIKYKSLFR